MLDLVISFDTTGSMSPCIAEVRHRVEQFVREIYTRIPDLRLAIVRHGDYIDMRSSYLYETTGFCSEENKKVVLDFIREVRNTHGGDAPEAYEYVLYKANSMDWRPDAKKAMIVIGDQEPHTYEHIQYDRDARTSNISPIDWNTELFSLIDKEIRVYPVQCLASSKVTFYKIIAQRCNTPYLRLHQFSNALEAIVLIGLDSYDKEQSIQYAQQLYDNGLVNRSLAEFIDRLSGNVKDDLPPVYTPSSRTSFHTDFDVKDLQSVEPWRFQVLNVPHNQDIKSFVQDTGAIFKLGRGFYQLSKTELVQERKEVVLVDRKTGDIYSGPVARQMLGLPYGKRGRVGTYNIPAGYDVFIQSTSPNRKLIGGTKFLYEVE